MFNDKSTAAERQQVLQAILRRGAAAAGGSPHTAAEVNALLARSAEELAAFEDMDAAAPPPGLLRPEEVRKTQCHLTLFAQISFGTRFAAHRCTGRRYLFQTRF